MDLGSLGSVNTATWTAPAAGSDPATFAVTLSAGLEYRTANVTVPAAPRLNATVLPAAVGLKPVPRIVTVVALWERSAVLAVTVGAATTVAT